MLYKHENETLKTDTMRTAVTQVAIFWPQLNANN